MSQPHVGQCRRLVTLVSVILACSLLWVEGCRHVQQATVLPSGYRVRFPEASQTLRLRPLPLTVQVTDAAGVPVDDLQVRFRIPEAFADVAELEPPTVTTRNGRATSTFRARRAGRIVVEITVQDHAEAVHITVLGENPRF